jgi:GT2 family glycosyltransferase
MNIQGLVRVVILNYNQAEYTLQCLESVMRQNHPSFDVVVVDNASRQQDFDLLEQRLPERVKLIRNSSNLGFSAGNNVGARALEGLSSPEFLFFLNSDTILEDTETLRILVEDMDLMPKCVASSPLIDTFSTGLDVRRQIQVRRIPGFSDVLVSYSPWLKRLPFLNRIFRRHIYAELVPYEMKVYEVETINGAAFLMKNSLFEQIRGLDEGTFLYFEELILGKQISDLNFKCNLNAKISIKHFQGVSTNNNKRNVNRKMLNYEIRSEFYYLTKYTSIKTAEKFVFGATRVLDRILNEVKGLILAYASR